MYEVIRRMWQSGICTENLDSPTDSMKEAMAAERKRYDELCATLKDEQITLLISLLNAAREVSRLDAESSFVSGYRTATRIMLESLK